jgi:hypothetical protein
MIMANKGAGVIRSSEERWLSTQSEANGAKNGTFSCAVGTNDDIEATKKRTKERMLAEERDVGSTVHESYAPWARSEFYTVVREKVLEAHSFDRSRLVVEFLCAISRHGSQVRGLSLVIFFVVVLSSC